MGWLAILTALLPLLQAFLELFKKAQRQGDIPPRALAKLQQVIAACGQVNFHANRCGIGAPQMEQDDDGPELSSVQKAQWAHGFGDDSIGNSHPQ